jgi:hypothetical protein
MSPRLVPSARILALGFTLALVILILALVFLSFACLACLVCLCLYFGFHRHPTGLGRAAFCISLGVEKFLANASIKGVSLSTRSLHSDWMYSFGSVVDCVNPMERRNSFIS